MSYLLLSLNQPSPLDRGVTTNVARTTQMFRHTSIDSIACGIDWHLYIRREKSEQNVGGGDSAFTVHRILVGDSCFSPRLEPHQGSKRRNCSVEHYWWVNEHRVPLRFQIGLALVAQDHWGMEFVLTMARHVIVVPFRDNGCEPRLY